MKQAPEIMRADPAARRRAVVLLAAFTIVGASVIAAFDAWFQAVAKDPAVVVRVAWLVVAGLTAVPAFMAAYLAMLGTRIRRAGVFPPPGFVPVKDTPVRRGEQARRMAAWCMLGAVLLAVGALTTPVLFWRLMRLLEGGQ